MTQALVRIENDFYPTPDTAAIVKQLTARVDIRGTVFEPCAGDGAIAKQFPACITNEPYCEADSEYDFGRDATQEDSWKLFAQPDAYPRWGIDWTVTNPPFNKAHLILPLAYDYSRVGVAFLLRLTYLEPCSNRADWLKAHADQMRCVIPLNPRPRFRSDTKGTDSTTCAWFVWEKAWSWKALGVDSPFQFERWK